MSGFAASWYRVGALQPRLRAHADIVRHTYRGRLWYVLRDRQTGRFFRISPGANLLLSLMDGRRTMEQIWRLAGERLGRDRPTRADTLGLLSQIHRADLLLTGLPPDMAELDRRALGQQRNPVLTMLRNPMAMRFPLLDPDRFLNRTAPAAALIFNRVGLVLWAVLIVTALVLVALHWPELSGGVSDRVFSTENALIFVLVYPAVKLVHELAHAYTAKLGGGEVHEVGIMLLVLFPVPYVDASAASAFPDKWRRAGVAAAGVMAELALAAIAMIAWTELPPGLPRAIAFNVMLLSGVTTVLFNANPLLRFDGYYVLSDLIEIPNLDARAKRYLHYLAQRYLLGAERASSPTETPGEWFWLAGYGLVSSVYRLVVLVGITLLVASKYFVVGAILAVMSIGQAVALPLLRGLRLVISGPALRRRRRRAVLGAAGAGMLVVLLLFVVALPRSTFSEGIVWIPDEATIRAGADGVVDRLLVPADTEIAAGTRLIALTDPVASAQVDVDAADVAVLENRFLAVNLIDRPQALLVHDALDRSRARLEAAQRHRDDLTLVSARAGRLVVPDAAHLVGRFVRKGTVLAYVIGAEGPDFHVVVPQSEIDLVRRNTTGVTIRVTEDVGRTIPARIVRETPSALDRVPAPGLSQDGGGPMLIDPSRPGHDTPLERFYAVELQPIDQAPLARIGSHVYARFAHPPEAIAWRLWRDARQALLQRLGT